MNVDTYPKDMPWTYSSQRRDHTRTTTLELYWEAHLDPISDDYTPDDIDAAELFGKWVRYLDSGDGWSHRLGKPWVDIYWFVGGDGTFESAPAAYDALTELPKFAKRPRENFLTFYTWPHHEETGEPLNWHRLPVADKLWRPGDDRKGGFIQEATSWKPSPFQAFVNVETLRAGLPA